MAFTAVCFIDIFIDKQMPNIPRYHLQSAPVVAVAILILPIIDTLNVIFVRLVSRKSLFEADKNHIHHKVLKLNITHRRASFYIMLYYVFIVTVAYSQRHLNINLLLALVMVLGFIGAYIPNMILYIRKRAE